MAVRKTLLKVSKEKELYDKEIAPIMNELKKVCRKYKLPMFATVCINAEKIRESIAIATENGTKPENIPAEYENLSYVNEMVSPFECNVNLTPDYIAECLKIINGFHAVLNTQDVIDMDDFM